MFHLGSMQNKVHRPLVRVFVVTQELINAGVECLFGGKSLARLIEAVGRLCTVDLVLYGPALLLN
jgi:hypothetical protein